MRPAVLIGVTMRISEPGKNSTLSGAQCSLTFSPNAGTAKNNVQIIGQQPTQVRGPMVQIQGVRTNMPVDAFLVTPGKDVRSRGSISEKDDSSLGQPAGTGTGAGNGSVEHNDIMGYGSNSLAALRNAWYITGRVQAHGDGRRTATWSIESDPKCLEKLPGEVKVGVIVDCGKDEEGISEDNVGWDDGSGGGSQWGSIQMEMEVKPTRRSFLGAFKKERPSLRIDLVPERKMGAMGSEVLLTDADLKMWVS